MSRLRELSLMRLVAQGVVDPERRGPADAVRILGAVQAQDLRAATTAIALRTRSRSLEEVAAALDSGEVVRSWPMRGTLHFVPAEDLGWMLGLTSERTIAATARRRAELGLDRAAIGAAAERAGEALAGAGSMTRKQLRSAWERAGISTEGQRFAHMLGYLCYSGLLCLGPTLGGDQRVVLLEQWVARPRRLEGEQALAEWALRYFRGHGPATVRDMAWWTKLPLRQVELGLSIASPRLERIEVEGVEYHMDPETPDRLARCRRRAQGVFLLPGFDELMLGYKDREALLAPEFAGSITPGGNGVFRPFIVSGGRAVGTWKRAGRAGEPAVEATPFERFAGRTRSAIPRRFRDLP